MSFARSAAVVARSLFCAIAMTAPMAAHAAGGGGGGGACNLVKDLTLELGDTTLHVSQSIFDGKTYNFEIDGYTLVPNTQQLSLRIVGPRREVYEAPLTLVGAKRCMAYYVGKAVLVSGPVRKGDDNKIAHR